MARSCRGDEVELCIVCLSDRIDIPRSAYQRLNSQHQLFQASLKHVRHGPDTRRRILSPPSSLSISPSSSSNYTSKRKLREWRSVVAPSYNLLTSIVLSYSLFHYCLLRCHLWVTSKASQMQQDVSSSLNAQCEMRPSWFHITTHSGANYLVHTRVLST
jgi:hypothetical protein